jgi:adenine-specific DNA-methyltransferase
MPTLNWLSREENLKTAAKTEYRLLEEVQKYSYGDPDSGNLIVQGDNLEALKALLPFYAGQIKCIYIDPPYNTGSAFEHYDDNMEHTLWLSMMYPRLELLKQFLSRDGSIFIQLDDNEQAYAKVLCDEIFGRNNFVTHIVWQKRTSPDNRLRLGSAQDYILVYTKNEGGDKKFNQLEANQERIKDFKNPDNDPLGPWASVDITGMTGHATPNQFYTIISPSGKKIPPPDGRCWALAEDTLRKLMGQNRIWFGLDGNSRPRQKRYLSELEGQNAWSWWTNEEVGHNQEAKKETNVLFGADNPFDTPKPERLIQRILTLATNHGDFVLDSFLGSGTTAAVAHKMGRKYIGVEMGEQAKTHCAVRLQKVIDGEQGGISETVGWKGGGGFRFFKLGNTVFDNERRIKADISFENLAAHIFFTETKTPMKKRRAPADKLSPFLGVHNGIGYALLYNGILHDTAIEGGNVLTHKTLFYILTTAEKTGAFLGETYERLVIYGEASRLPHDHLKDDNIEFKQTPYDIKVW